MEAKARRTAAQESAEEVRLRIRLGDLVVQAGLGDVDAELLEAGLIDLASTLQDPQERARLRAVTRKDPAP